jgi:hypothetical protein
MVSVTSTSSSLANIMATTVLVFSPKLVFNNIMVEAANIVSFRFSAYDPLSFVAFPNHTHDLPTGEYRKRLPFFAGKFGVSVEDHLADFLKVVDDCEVEYKDVAMRMFVHTLKEDARTWYKSLLDASIDEWDSFQEKFTERWADKQDNFFLLKYFDNLKRNEMRL